jgi:hypothetical protein
METLCPFPLGSFVRWSDIAPKDWLYLHTAGEMVVVGAFYQDGTPNEYAKKFSPVGMGFEPGWVITVEYDSDSTDYYNPPMSTFFGKRMVKMLHEKWLVRA